MEKTYKVFVYGTLKKGKSNHRFLENAEYLGEKTLWHYALYDLGPFPCILPRYSFSVKGELYLVTDKELQLLDRLEGHPDMYQRQIVCVEPTQEDAFTYVWNGKLPSRTILIPNGVW